MADASPAPPAVGADQALWLDAELARVRDGCAAFAVPFEEIERAFGDELLIVVDPVQLTHQLSDNIAIGGSTVSPVYFFLGGGDWMGAGWLKPITGSRVYREGEQILRRSGAFRKTASYAQKLKNLESGKSMLLNHVNIDSIEKLDAYYRNYRRMIHRARSQGIVPRGTFVIRDTLRPKDVNIARPLWAEVAERDIGVAIDAGGNLCRLGPGQHRTAVAKLLGLARLPCEVRCVHADWLQQRIDETGMTAFHALRVGLMAIRQRTL
jgi:hypothetical protein